MNFNWLNCETMTIASTSHISGIGKAYVKKAIGKLNSSKVGTFKNIPTKYLKVTSCENLRSDFDHSNLFQS